MPDSATECLERSGVYRILHRPSGEFYVGSSKFLKGRWIGHIDSFLKGKASRRLQAKWNESGPNGLLFEILEVCSDERERLLSAEQRWIDLLRPTLNTCPTAGSCRGRVMTAEHRAKIGSALRGRPATQEARRNLDAGRKHERSPEERERLAAMCRERNRNFQWTPDVRAKHKAALTGRRLSPEHKAKISLGLRNFYGGGK